MKKYFKKLSLVLLTIVLLFQVINFSFVEAAYYDDNTVWKEITSTVANQTLLTGNYKVTSSRTINTPSAGQNGLNISGTVNLYIKSGVTLTVNGGKASGTTGAGAGIHLPGTAILRVYGGGQIIANGGQASAPTQGGSPLSGSNGAGGNGGGGAGAGIGGKGGNGGVGGVEDGTDGTDGTAGTSSGTLYVYDTVTVKATGGIASNSSLSQAGNGGSMHGAGGNGGYAGKAANIGSGGSGGGGGGAGSKRVMMTNGNGGSGGGGSSIALGGAGGSGTMGKPGTPGNNSSGLSGGIAVVLAGAGGNSVQGASGGRIFKSSSSSVTQGSTNPSKGEGGTSSLSTMTTIDLDHNNGSSALSSIAGTSGQALPGIETFPTRTGYDFTGYYSGSGGTGTKYINADGSSTGAVWSSGSTIYAGWEGKKYTLTIVKDGIDSFSVNGATKVNDTQFTMTYGTEVTLTATPEIGKTFVAWYGTTDDTYTSPSNPYTFSPPAKDITFKGTAMFGVWVEDSLDFNPSDFKQETFYSTATINVQLDGVKKEMGNVTLENGTDVINVSGTNGVYTYKNILDATGKEYKVYVGGEDTGQVVKFNNQTGTNITVDYYSTTIRTTLDGTKYNPGTIEFLNQSNTSDKITVFYDDDLGYTYYYRLKDTANTYRVMVNGKDTGEDIDFTKKYDITLDYHTALVNIKVDGNLRDMGTITLQNQNGIQYTLSSNGGVYKIIDRNTSTYDIFLNGVDTKKDVTFNNTKVDINYFTVDYVLTNQDASGSTPSAQIYKEGDIIKVAGAGNITRLDYHFAGWSDGNAVYPVNSDYTVTAKTTFEDKWEADSDSQAKWSFNNGTSWNYGTLADAVAVTKQTTTSLKVEIQRSGTMPNNTDITIRNNQSWKINAGVDVEILGNSKVTNQGTITNEGTLSGAGELINSGHVNNEKGVVKVVKVNNADGLLYGGTYGEIKDTNPVRIVITGGIVKAVDANTNVILGDYSTMKDVSTFSDETTISVMGNITVTGAPTNDQLSYNFGGLVTYDKSTNTIKQTCNLFFRNKVVIKDTVWDSDDNTHVGLETPRVFASVFEEKTTTTKEYVANEGGTVSITYVDSVNGPSTSAEMLVPSGASVTLNATADTSNGYEFVGWYQGVQTDGDGNTTGFTTKVSTSSKITIDNIQAESGYYAVFKKKQFTLKVATDSATTAKVFSDTTSLASLGNKEEADVSVDFGGNIIVEPKLEPDVNDPLHNSYSFLGFMRNYDDGTTEQVIQYESVPKYPNLAPDDSNQEFVDVPITMPYTTSARANFDYTLSTLSVIKGWLRYDMNGGELPIGSTEVIENIDLLTDQTNTYTLSNLVPVKQGWEFIGWERQDAGDPTHTRYDPEDEITLTGEEEDAGVLLVAVYKRDSKTQYYVEINNSNPVDEIGYTSLNEAVEATQDNTSTVFGQKVIYFNAGDNTAQVGEVSGLLPNGYTLKSKTSAKLTVSSGKTLQIGDETSANTNNSNDGSWKTGAHVENIEFINNQGTIKFDGQHSWIENGGFTLYPDSKVHLLSDLNTGNILNITLWDSVDIPADIINSSSWKKDSVVVTSEVDDGDTSTVDGNDTNFNLMSGRVRIMNDGYSVYNDLTTSTTNGYSLRVFASSDVKAMRTPLNDASLDYSDENFIIEYPTIQAAIDDAARCNIGGNGIVANNNIWIVGSSSEDFVISGDNPDMNASHFNDYGDQTYNNEVTFMAGKRTRLGATLKVEADTAVYTLSGKIGLTEVKTTNYTKETIFNLNNFILSGSLSIDEESYINVTNQKTWSQDETITILPSKDASNNDKYAHKQVIAVDGNGESSAHFKLDNDAHIKGYGISFTQADSTIKVVYLGDPVKIIEDINDVKTIVGEDAVFTTKVNYPTDIEGVAITPDDQGFAYKWYQKDANDSWSEIIDTTNMKVEYDNGTATLTYTVPEVKSISNDTQFKCEVFNNRGVSTKVIPVTREAKLEVENTPSVFVQIPKEVVLNKTEPTVATNMESDEQDLRNVISLITFNNESNSIDGNTGNAETPNEVYTIKTEQTLELTLNGSVETDPSKKYTAWVLKSDYKTLLPEDQILMELQKGKNEEERFYLRMPLGERKPLGLYKANMTFVIDYRKP